MLQPSNPATRFAKENEHEVRNRYTLVPTVWTTAVMMPGMSWAQNGDLAHRHPALPDAAVDFGVLPTGPLGPAPCLQEGAIGGPADPCSYKKSTISRLKK